MRRYRAGVRRGRAGVLVVELFNQETIPARSVSNVNAHRIHDQEGGKGSWGDETYNLVKTLEKELGGFSGEDLVDSKFLLTPTSPAPSSTRCDPSPGPDSAS